jgi:hypothetical protein
MKIGVEVTFGERHITARQVSSSEIVIVYDKNFGHIFPDQFDFHQEICVLPELCAPFLEQYDDVSTFLVLNEPH